MATPTFTVGEVLTANLVNQWLEPLAAYKASDTSRSSTTTLADDPALTLAVSANCTYLLQCYLDYEGGTNGSSDLKFQWTVPASATLRFYLCAPSSAGITLIVPFTSRLDTTAYNIGTNGAGVLLGASMIGTLNVSSTAGNLTLQWAQNTSSGTATILHAQSCLLLQRIA